MQIVLSPELEGLIQRKLDSGEYDSAAEVVRDALYLLDEVDRFKAQRLAELRRDIAVGLDQLDRGETVTFDEELAERIKARGRERLREATAGGTEDHEPGRSVTAG